MKFTISAPGKIILMGEHAVVYGKPAIVAAINKRMTVKLVRKNGPPTGGLEISANSEIPYGVGMGFSAAQAVLSAASLFLLYQKINKLNNKTKKLINEIAYEQEKINHGNPSGVDNTVITYGGLLWFKRRVNGPPILKRLKIKNLPPFILINTGCSRETTRQMVENVKCQASNIKTKRQVLGVLSEIEEQTKKFLKALKKKDEKLLKNSIKICQRNLEKLGVVSEFGKRIIREIEKIGGAAKITGAGGKTFGSGMLLCYHKNPKKIVELGKKLKLETIKVKLGGEGVTIK